MKMSRMQQPINGYSDAGQRNKDTFMRTAAKYLKAIGTAMAKRHGLTECKINKNAGGIACAGDVYAEYYKPGEAYGVYATMGADIGVGLGREGDGVHLMARWIQRNADKNRSRTDGPNTWIHPTIDSDEMADKLAGIAEAKNASAKTPAVPQPS